MRTYSVNGAGASASATKTGAGITSNSSRPAVYELVVGSTGTPADQNALVALSRSTAAGTSTAFTPIQLDSADVAAGTTAGVAHSVEPTYTASNDLIQIPLHQRGTFRWVAPQPGFEFKVPNTASNGVGSRLVSASAAMVINHQIFFFE